MSTVHRGLGGERTQEHTAGDRGLPGRASVSQACNGGTAALMTTPRKNEPEGRPRGFALRQSRQAGFAAVQQVNQNAAEQQRAAQNVDQQIAVSGCL